MASCVLPLLPEAQGGGGWGGGGGYSGFQVTGMIEEFLELEIFDSEIFLGRKIWQIFFRVA